MPQKFSDILPPRSERRDLEGKEIPLSKSLRKRFLAKSKKTDDKKIPEALPSKLSPQDQFLATLAKSPRRREAPQKRAIPTPSKKDSRPRRRRLGIFLPLFFVFVVLFTLYGIGLFGARAQIELITVKNFQPFEIEARLKHGPQEEELKQGIIALEKVQKKVSLSREYPSSGEGKTVSSRARGKILIFNAYSKESQVLVERTRFLSPDGKLFRLSARVTVPGAKVLEGGLLESSSIEATVIADEPGAAYNIGPAKFSIPGFAGTPRQDKFWGESREKFTGGSIGQGKVVTQEDIRKGQEDISRIAIDFLRRELSQGLPENFKLLEKANQVRITKLESSQKPGDGGDTFMVSIEAQITALVFEESDIKNLISQRFPPPATTSEDLLKSVFDINYEIISSNFDSGDLVLRVTGSRDIEQSLDILALKRALAGKNTDEVRRQILNLEGIEEAKVSLWPFWIKRIPRQIDRITVRVN